jgi:hypothetical protein
MGLKNTQDRRPPAYQEYASDLLSSRPFKRMTLAERGLYYTMKLECWVNGSCTPDINDLAVDLNLDKSEVELHMTNLVKSFFVGYPDKLVIEELEKYKLYLNTRRTQQSEGGKRGAEIRRKSKENPSSSGSETAKISLISK